MSTNKMKPRLILFDLDGTLVDSVPDLAFAVDAMLNDMGQSEAGAEQIRLWVGNGAQMLVKRALSKHMTPLPLDDSFFEQALKSFYHHYQQVNGLKSQLYPQVLETLKHLRKVVPFMALVTNKPEQFTRPLLDHHKLPPFDLLVCGDTLSTKKPDPAPLLYCLEKLNCHPHETVMIGDSVSDIKAAKAANIPVICVNYGYHQGEDLSAYQPEYLIERFQALLAILGREQNRI
jgi:phosphoglycolate phosphatase